MDFEVGGAKMGQSVMTRTPVELKLTIAAPSEIEKAEVVRLDVRSGVYNIASHWNATGRVLEANFTDEPQGKLVMYYLRVQLREPVRGRVVRGWSSPIWLVLEEK